VFGRLNVSVRSIRSEMGLSQSELANLVGVGKRAVQSYEQGWRRPSEMVQRTLLLLLIARRNGAGLSQLRCWDRKKCPAEVRGKCIAHLTRQGHLCWFLTGTMCEGKARRSWAEKLETCLDCDFMQLLLHPRLIGALRQSPDSVQPSN